MANQAAPFVYRIPGLASRLGCTEAAARHLVERNQIPSRRLGRRVIVLAEDLEAYLRSLARRGEGQ